MKRCLIALSVFVISTLNAHGDDAAKIIGTWNVMKLAGKEPPKGSSATIEFTKEGKLIFTVDAKKISEATYKVDGNKITVTNTRGGKEQQEVITIKSITGDVMMLLNEKKNETMEMRKK